MAFFTNVSNLLTAAKNGAKALGQTCASIYRGVKAGVDSVFSGVQAGVALLKSAWLSIKTVMQGGITVYSQVMGSDDESKQNQAALEQEEAKTVHAFEEYNKACCETADSLKQLGCETNMAVTNLAYTGYSALKIALHAGVLVGEPAKDAIVWAYQRTCEATRENNVDPLILNQLREQEWTLISKEPEVVSERRPCPAA